MNTPNELHCEDCDPSFLTCWNDGSKCCKRISSNYTVFESSCPTSHPTSKMSEESECKCGFDHWPLPCEPAKVQPPPPPDQNEYKMSAEQRARFILEKCATSISNSYPVMYGECIAELTSIIKERDELSKEKLNTKDSEISCSTSMMKEYLRICDERDELKHLLECINTPMMRDVLAERDAYREKAEALDWLEENMTHYIVDTDTLIPPKWFITDPTGKGVLVRRAESLLSAINAARSKV